MKARNLNELVELINVATEDEIAEVAKSFCSEVGKLLRPYCFLRLADVAKIVSRKEDFKRIGNNLHF